MFQKHAENIYSFKINLPKNPLGWLNSYVIRGLPGERDLLIDTGFNTPYCLESLRLGMEELELDPHELDVFVTHAHFDHVGNVGHLADMGCRIYLSGQDYEFYRTEPWVWQLENSRKDGIPDELRLALDMRRGRPGPFHPELVEEGRVISVGGYHLECIHTPGHTPGHLCLYDPKARIMFTGDQLLFNITPNISFIDDGIDTLKDYLESLDKIARYPVDLALPGHRGVGGKGFLERIEELKRHHDKRLKEAEQAVRDYGPACAYEIAQHMSWSIRAKSWEDFPNNQKWFATAETLAHLVYLQGQGRLVNRREPGGLSTYSLA